MGECDLFGYGLVYQVFWIDDVMVWLLGDMEIGINVCIECCDCYCQNDWLVLCCIVVDGSLMEYGFWDLCDLLVCVVNLLSDKGIQFGDVVVGLMLCIVDLVVLIFGIWWLGVVYQLLFIVFGFKVIVYCLQISGVRLVVIDFVNCVKLDMVEDCLQIVLVRIGDQLILVQDIDFCVGLVVVLVDFVLVLWWGDDLFMMMVIFGMMGFFKGVFVLLCVLFVFEVYMCEVVDLWQGDVFWNIVDFGWVYGLYYVICGLLFIGVVIMLYEGGFIVDLIFGLIWWLGVINFVGLFIVFCLLIVVGVEVVVLLKG